MDDLTETLERVAIADLRPHPRNYLAHPPAQLDHLRQSIDEHGIYRNVVIARDGTLLAGHGVVQAAQQQGYTHVSVKRLDVDPESDQALKVLVGDNELARLRLADDALLVGLLEQIGRDDPTALLGTGFDVEALAILAEASGLGDNGGEQAGRDVEPQIDRAEQLAEQWGTALGQLWALGDHRLIVGDCTDKAVVERLMGDGKTVLCHADPPYGMGKEAEGIANDNLYASKLDAFQMRWWKTARPFLEDNASAYIWGNAEDLWRLWYVGGLRDSERLTIRNELVWDKAVPGENPTMLVTGVPLEGRRMYQPTERCLFFMLGEQGFSTNADNYWDGWEPIRAYLEQERLKMGWDVPTMKRIVGHSDLSRDHWTSKSQWSFPTREVYEALQHAARGDGFKRDYDDLKRDYYATRAYFDNTHDTMTDVWDFARVKGAERHDHPTPKPVALIERMIKSSAPARGLVYDPFMGSGTTLIACENLGRICYGCELDPGYVAVTLQRWADLMGRTPQLL
jgi:DNA modification methylase